MNLSDIINAYQQWGQGNREMMGNVPGLLPLLDATASVAETPGIGMAIPATGPFGLPMKERLSALMENPMYLQTPLRQRLAILKGIPSGEVSPSIGRSTARLKEMVGTAKATEGAMRNTPLGQASEAGRRVGSIPFPYPNWLQELLKGGKP